MTPVPPEEWEPVDRWLFRYLTSCGGRADHFEVLQAAWDVNPSWTTRRLRHSIRHVLGGSDAPAAFAGGPGRHWVFDLHRPVRFRQRPERPAAGWPSKRVAS
jgi:hypothetical protein